MKISFRDLVDLIATKELEDVYSILQYDYEAESLFAKGAGGECNRERFLDLMSWASTPSSTEIKRLFNQINTAAAEKWSARNPGALPETFLKECNELILMRHGKKQGLRRGDIEFGIRKDIDFLDPRRQFKLLRGITPPKLGESLRYWGETVASGPGDADLALALSILLTTIHPFIDGNGRLARVAYSWLRTRWGLPAEWLAEDQEGEFLRTGFGLRSTDHLMAAVMLDACEGHNSVRYGQRSDDADLQAFEALRRTFKHLRSAESLVHGSVFQKFREHLREDKHFRRSSPRFDSLRSVLQ